MGVCSGNVVVFEFNNENNVSQLINVVVEVIVKLVGIVAEKQFGSFDFAVAKLLDGVDEIMSLFLEGNSLDGMLFSRRKSLKNVTTEQVFVSQRFHEFLFFLLDFHFQHTNSIQFLHLQRPGFCH